ncbi:MAG: GreA/GreB family elongation factor [Kiritimatiellae bacterium]|nr:GreA/GreB family elongation factor [Kiritimatiellia bacterium]
MAKTPPQNATSARSYRERGERLAHLVDEELPRNRRDIQEAREFGDLSENFEYESARAKERQLLSRMETLQRELKETVPFDYAEAQAGDAAGVATSVVLAYPDGSRRTVNILGLWDFDRALGIISCEAPLALKIAGVRAGDVVELPDPDFDDETLSVTVESVGPLPPEVLEWAK